MKKLTQNKIDKMISDHAIWLETRHDPKVEGSRADFSDCNISGLSFPGVDLSYAILTNAIVGKTDLSGTNLAGAQMVQTRFDGCNLQSAR